MGKHKRKIQKRYNRLGKALCILPHEKRREEASKISDVGQKTLKSNKRKNEASTFKISPTKCEHCKEPGPNPCKDCGDIIYWQQQKRTLELKEEESPRIGFLHRWTVSCQHCGEKTKTRCSNIPATCHDCRMKQIKDYYYKNRERLLSYQQGYKAKRKELAKI